MADKYTMETVAIGYCFEILLQDRAAVEEAQCQRVHRSACNNNHSADTPNRDHILDVTHQSNPPDGERWGHYSIDMAEVMVKVKA